MKDSQLSEEIRPLISFLIRWSVLICHCSELHSISHEDVLVNIMCFTETRAGTRVRKEKKNGP